MANEAVNIELPKIIKRGTVAEATAIPLGTILKVSSDPDTLEASSAADIFGGITVEEFTGGEGLTNVGVALDGVWDLTCAGSGCTLGHLVALSGANLIRDSVEADFPLGAVFGKALETGSAGEVVKVRLGIN